MTQANLSFNMELKGLSNILKAVDKSSVSLNDKLSQSMSLALNKYKEGLKTIKLAPFQNAKFHEDLAELKEKLKQATSAKIRLNMDEAKQKLSSLKGEVIASVASLGALSLPVKTAMDFESSMADVKKVVDFSGASEVKAFSNELLALSRAIPLSVDELAQITASGGQLGIAKSELISFTTTASKMGVAFDMSAKEAGENMAKLMNIYSLGVKEVAELGDTINHISNNSAATASKIVEAVGRVAGNAKDFGLSADATAGLTSAFISLGKAPEVAATAINSMLTTLNNADRATGKLEEAFLSIGINGAKLKKEIMANPQKALDDFLIRISKLPKEQKTGVLTELFGKNFSDDISLVTGAIENYQKAMRLSTHRAKNGSMNEEFKARSATTANSLQLLKNAFSEVGVRIGSIFLPYINKAIEAISKITGKISGFIAL